MAQAHRLYTSAEYIALVAQMRTADTVRIATFSMYARKVNSRLLAVLTFLDGGPAKVEILVGHNGAASLANALAVARRFKRIDWRFSEHTHVKFAVCEREKKWNGFLGSANLTDSMMLDYVVELHQGTAKQLAGIHDTLFRTATPIDRILTAHKDLAFINQPIMQANHAGS